MLISVVASIILTSTMVTSTMAMSTVVTSTLVASIILMVNVDHGDHECHWAKIQQTNANGKRSKALPICQIYLYYAKFDLFSSESLLNSMGKEH